MTLSTMLNFLFFTHSHPMMLMMLTVAQCLTMCLVIYSKTSVAWLSYILFMIFLGGMMILFSYVCSLASNEPIINKMNMKSIYPVSIIGLLMCLISVSANNKMNCAISETFLKMFNKMFFTITMLIMVYMLLVMVIVVKNMSLQEGPLRTKKN